MTPAKRAPAKRAPAKRAPARKAAPDDGDRPFDLGAALLHAFDTNDRINQYLLAHLPPGAWTAAPPGGKGRTVAAIVAHVHNVRLMWLKAVGAAALPAPLDKATVTVAEAAAALEASRAALAAVLAASLAGGGRVKGFKPDVASFFGYLVAHDAHHRGQIAQLARQAGHPLPQAAMFGMWEWGSRAKA